MLQKVQVSSAGLSFLLSASAVATVNTNTSPLMHIFHQYNIFMKILSTILKDRKDTSKFPRKSV